MFIVGYMEIDYALRFCKNDGVNPNQLEQYVLQLSFPALRRRA